MQDQEQFEERVKAAMDEVIPELYAKRFYERGGNDIEALGRQIGRMVVESLQTTTRLDALEKMLVDKGIMTKDDLEKAQSSLTLPALEKMMPGFTDAVVQRLRSKMT